MYKTILISAENEYSFRHITQSIIQELIRKNKVVVLIPTSWHIEDLIFNYKNEKNISFIRIDNNLKNLHAHKKLYQRFKEMLDAVQPDIVLQNDYISAYNIYLFYAARMCKKEIANGVFLNSMPSSKNTKNLVRQLYFPNFSKNCDIILEIYKLVKMPLIYLKLFITNFIIISLVIRNLSPNRSLNLLNVDTIMKYKIFDFIFCYHETEKSYLQNLFKSAKYDIDIIQVKFPSMDVPKISQDKFIIILPSLLCYRYSVKQEKRNIDRYIDCVRLISSKYPDYKICIKCHPNLSVKKTKLLLGIFEKSFRNIVIINSEISVADIITDESIIVSDVSSVLWQCNHSRVSIGCSIILELYATAEDMRSYEKICLMRDSKNECIQDCIKLSNGNNTDGCNDLETIESAIGRL